MLEQLDIQAKKKRIKIINLDANLTFYVKIDSKWIKDLTVKLTTKKIFMKKNTEENLQGIEVGKDFLRRHLLDTLA